VRTTYVQDGDLLNYTPVAAVVAGDIVFRGALCCQIANSGAAGELLAVRPSGVIRVPKNLADVFDVASGTKVRWNAATSLAALTVDPIMGTAVGGGTAADTYVDVLLNR